MLWSTHNLPVADSDVRFRILYVGDDLQFLSALRKPLGEADHKVVSCMDRGSAVLFLEGDPRYDLLLLDLELLDAAGFELVKLAQSLRHRRRTPIVVVSAERNVARFARLCSSAGIEKCLSKRTVSAIVKAIRLCLGEMASVTSN